MKTRLTQLALFLSFTVPAFAVRGGELEEAPAPAIGMGMLLCAAALSGMKVAKSWRSK